mgnify:CR=1 FL=1
MTVENRLAVQMELDLENLSYRSEVPKIVVNDDASIKQSLASFDAYSLLTYNSIDHQDNFDGNMEIERGHSSRRNSIVTFDSYDLHERQPKKQGYSVVKWMDSMYELFQEPESKEEEDVDDDIVKCSISKFKCVCLTLKSSKEHINLCSWQMSQTKNTNNKCRCGVK